MASAAAPVPSHSPHVHAHYPDATTFPKDSKSPPILLPLETLSIMITSPLFLGPPLTWPRLQTLDTLHGTSDTRSSCGRFLWAPELALRAVEEAPEGQVSSLAAGTRVSSGPCPQCFTLRSRDPPPGSHSWLHAPAFYPTRSPTCSGPGARWPKHLPPPDYLQQLSRKRREDKQRLGSLETQPRGLSGQTLAQKDTQRPDRSPGPPRRAHMLG